MLTEGHEGGVVVSISDPVKYVPQKAKKKKKWRCPVCKKQFKSAKAAKQHMEDKKHMGKAGEVEGGKAKAKEEQTEGEVAPKGPVKMWCRLAEPHWLQIKDNQEFSKGLVSIECPATGNHLIQYDDRAEFVLDYLMFLHNFVEIELELGDVLYILSQLPSDLVLEVKDIATLKIVPLEGVSVGGCILINPESETPPSVGGLIGLLSPFSERTLACVGGIWEKKKPITTPTKSKGRSGTDIFRRPRRDFYDEYGGYAYMSEEEEGTVVRPESNILPYRGRVGGGDLVPPVRTPIMPPSKPADEKKVEKPILKFHPVYKISEEYIYTDRVIDYAIYTE